MAIGNYCQQRNLLVQTNGNIQRVTDDSVVDACSGNCNVFKQNPSRPSSVSGITEELALTKFHLSWQALQERLSNRKKIF